MELHRRTGAVFGAFCLLMLAWNIATPANEDHWINVIEHSVLSVIFLVSTMTSFRVSGFLQVLAFFLASWIATYTGDMQPSAVLGTTAVLLTFIYSRFHTLGPWLTSVVTTAQFFGVFSAASIAGYSPLISLGHACVWTMFSLVGVWLLWVAMQQFSSRVLKNSIEVHEINKTLMKKGPGNGTKKT